MREYTPTTEEVRIRYSKDDRYRDEAIEAKWAAEFDRWLAATLAAEYQRGREDAAKAVEALHFPIDLETVYGIDSPKKLACDHCAYIFYEGRRNFEREPWPCSTVTAARGGGETSGT